MADVYLAAAAGPHGFSKLVVIKKLRTEFGSSSSLVGMFHDEARLAARLNHPNVIHVYEVGEQAGAHFIAMEHLDGQSLNRVLKRAPGNALPVPLCARIAADALAGLHYAHELRDYDGSRVDLVHRDVSPHNVFVTYGGQVKVVDFGIAKAALSRTQTEVGTLKGKFAYMSPEQAEALPIDRRSDVFSMGAVLWEMLAGRRLFGDEGAAVTIHRVVSGPIARVASVAPEVDADLDGIVARALDRDPAKRFETAGEMRRALVAWADGRSDRRLPEEEDLGRFVGDLFQDVRAEMRQTVQSHMHRLAEEIRRRGSAPTLSVDVAASAGLDGTSPSATSTRPFDLPLPAPQTPRSRLAVAGSVTAGALAVALIAGVLHHSSRAAAAHAPQARDTTGAAGADPPSAAIALPANPTNATAAMTAAPAGADPVRPSLALAPATASTSVRAPPPSAPPPTTTSRARSSPAHTVAAPESRPPSIPASADSPAAAPGAAVFAAPPKSSARSLDTSDPWSNRP